MKRRIIAVCLLAVVASFATAQQIRPRPRAPKVVVVPPPCDTSTLIDLLDEYFAPVPPPFPLPPVYCAARTCEAREQAEKYKKDAELLQAIDLMRQACRVYYP